MNPKDAAGEGAWAEKWLTSVASGGRTMSQRTLASIERRGGGLANVRKLATAMGVHLLLVEDESGTALVAASVKPFQVLC